MTVFVRAVALVCGVVAGCTYIRDDRTFPILSQGDAGGAPNLETVTALDHALFDVVLEGFAGAEGVDYDGLLEAQEYRFVLHQYLMLLGGVTVEQLDDTNEKAAFLANLYNGTVLHHVLERLDDGPDFRVDQDDFGFFDEPLVRLEGRFVSLNVLEHAILRGRLDHSSASVAALDEGSQAFAQELHQEVWQGEPFNPRLHFVLNCASRSCPTLPLESLRGGDLPARLDHGTEVFLSDPGRGAGPEGISRLFDWFAEDFESAGQSVQAFIEQYRSVDDANLESFLPYDWSLNRRGAS